MLINGWNIEEAQARQARFTDGHHALSNGSIWNAGSNRPIFQRNQMGFKNFTVELWVKGNGYQDIVDHRGMILAHLLDEAILELDWTTHKFKAALDKYSITEMSKQHFHVLKLDFIGYEYEDTEEYTINVSTSFTITNSGTTETPITLELTPIGGAIDIPYDQMMAYLLIDEDGALLIDEGDGAALIGYDYDRLTIKGLCKDSRTGEDLSIEIRNITPGEKIIIDGETGRITAGGVVKIDDVDIWNLPTLQPGDNLITTNNNWLSVTVRYKPRFM